MVRGYPKKGDPRSRSSIFEWCRDQLAVHCRLHGRNARHVSLPAELTIRGCYAAEAFKHVYAETREAGINLSKVPMARLLASIEVNSSSNDAQPGPLPADEEIAIVRWPKEEGEAERRSADDDLAHPIHFGNRYISRLNGYEGEVSLNDQHH